MVNPKSFNHTSKEKEKWKLKTLGSTPKGAHLFREPDGAGGYAYWTDEVSGGMKIWVTSLTDEGSLLMAMVCEHRRKYTEEYLKQAHKDGRDITSVDRSDEAGATGGSFLGPLSGGDSE